MNARREAIFILTRWMTSRKFPEQMISDGPNHALVLQLVYTTIKHYRSLEWVLKRFLKLLPHGETKAALLSGAAQLLYMPDIATHAAVYETVEAAKVSSRRSASLINGVLRNIARQAQALHKDLSQQTPGLRYSYPDLLVERWHTHFGGDATTQLCQWNNQAAETCISISPHVDATPLLECGVIPHPAHPSFYTIPRGIRVSELPGYDDGAFIVQNPASMPAIDFLELRPGLRVLDACAAPGGKTIQSAWRLQPTTSQPSSLSALEPHQKRYLRLQENLQRAHLSWVETQQIEFTNFTSQTPFDRILLDVPCTNSGVLQRRPDARWRWSHKQLERIVELQAALLEHALTFLAPHGILVYSTCSLEPEENIQQIEYLLQKHASIQVKHMHLQQPWQTQTDGGFACALINSPASS